MRRDPNATQMLGRQPEQVRITPSSIYPWYGFWEEGHRYSRGQEIELMRRGMDPATADGVLVKRQATHKEYYWPFRDLPPRFEFECPLLRRLADRIEVVAPSGEVKKVLPDGWIKKPTTIARDAWGVPV